jgi:hypothetical protein
LQPGGRWQLYKWCVCQLQTASRALPSGQSQLLREIGRRRPTPIDSLQLVEPEVEDVIRFFQDANLSQAVTKLEQCPPQDRHRQRQREVRVLTQRRNASRLGDEVEHNCA